MKLWTILCIMAAVNLSLAVTPSVADYFGIPFTADRLGFGEEALSNIPFQNSMDSVETDLNAESAQNFMFGDWFLGYSMLTSVLKVVFNMTTGNYAVWNALNIGAPFNMILTVVSASSTWVAVLYLITNRRID
ncbi:hypothetical protein GYY_02495 [Methanococcus maripaludis X1]|uniref:Uncharacterized protein n=1 Tax=Methanococcus maripaludis X1 TaxID=1053692 RepID=G0H3J2_METMI|nr:hypothetical protein [Methanococcus maripaludis]AEK19382.1 hypothetical protein GYY_02495 [Methanococcus maripaludis X1]